VPLKQKLESFRYGYREIPFGAPKAEVGILLVTVGHKVKGKDIFDAIEQCKTRIEDQFDVPFTNKQNFFGNEHNVINIAKPEHKIFQLV
jgi:hypothetical protein